MKGKKDKNTPVNDSKSIHSESEAKKDEAVVKYVEIFIGKAFRRENAILEEIKSYTDGKQIVLTNFKQKAYKISLFETFNGSNGKSHNIA